MTLQLNSLIKKPIIKDTVTEHFSQSFEDWWHIYTIAKNEITLDKEHCWQAWCAALNYIDETITILPVDRRQ